MNKKKKIEVKLEDLGEDSYVEIIFGLLRRAYTHVSADSGQGGVASAIYMFDEALQKETNIYKIGVVRRTAQDVENETEGVTLTEFRVKARTALKRDLRKARRACVEALFLAHVDSSLLLWGQTADMLKNNKSFQEKAREVVKKRRQTEQN